MPAYESALELYGDARHRRSSPSQSYGLVESPPGATQRIAQAIAMGEAGSRVECGNRSRLQLQQSSADHVGNEETHARCRPPVCSGPVAARRDQRSSGAFMHAAHAVVELAGDAKGVPPVRERCCRDGAAGQEVAYAVRGKIASGVGAGVAVLGNTAFLAIERAQHRPRKARNWRPSLARPRPRNRSHAPGGRRHTTEYWARHPECPRGISSHVAVAGMGHTKSVASSQISGFRHSPSMRNNHTPSRTRTSCPDATTPPDFWTARCGA